MIPSHGRGYADAAAYRRKHLRTGKPVVAFLFYAHSYPNDLTPLLREAEAQFTPFAEILPIGFSNQVDKDMEQLRAILTAEKVALVVNFMSFRLGAGPMGGNAAAGVELLKELDVPMLCPFYSSKRTVEEWDASPKGAAPGDFLISIMMPELDGGIETMPLAAVGTVHQDEVLHLPLSELQPLTGRVERLAGRAQKWLALQSKANADKKVALLCYDYPPEESHLFSAAFLDGFASLSAVLHALKQAGYTTEEKTPEELEQLFCAGGLLNSSRYLPDTTGLHYKPEELAYENEISAAWGKAPGSILTDAEGYRIPGVQLGNVFIGLQPARVGAGEDAAAHYHDRDLPPHHQYAAFYQWLREEFGADAVVHVGTHGTLEFLPGKENGLSADCWADRLLQDLPNLYYYYCGNASEGMTAKRRSQCRAADLCAAPLCRERPVRGAGCAGRCSDGIPHEAQQAAPERAASVRRQLEQQAAALQLPTEPEALEQELYRTRCALIPEGLHCIGEGQPGELEGLLHALNGHYVPAAPMGDVRRQPEILPTGRNGYAFDPRFVPSPAAYQRGAEIAKAAMERYKAEHGCWPRRTAVVLWGLETAKTQGETVGQLLYYLGARMVWKGTSFLSRIEPIPTEEMDRPRVDVTVTICGSFRDLFPALLADLNRLLRQLDEMHETSEESAYAAETERLYQKLLAQDLAPEKARAAARGRFFGPKDGEYGTSLTELVKSGQWQDEKELGSLFTAELGYLYAEGIEGERIPGCIEEAFRDVELISQVRGDADYEIPTLTIIMSSMAVWSRPWSWRAAQSRWPTSWILPPTRYMPTARHSPPPAGCAPAS